MNLRNYQIELSDAACDRLNRYKIAYLAMQVRTGKTITSLETAKKYGARTVLFITKKKAISSIEADYINSYKKDFVMYCCNYEAIHLLPLVNFDLIIIDEAHSLGQYPQPSQRTENIRDLAKNKPIIYLSGTPSPESYSQLYHQLWVSSYTPFPEKNFYKWAETYVDKRVKFMYNRQINDYSIAKEQLIKDKISHLMISFTQEEAGFESPVTEIFHTVEMLPSTYKAMNRLINDKVIKLKSGRFIEADTEVALMGKIHQMCSGTVITTDGGLTDKNSEAVTFDTSKAKYIIDNFTDHKIAIFYKFTMEYQTLFELLTVAGYEVASDPHTFNNTGNDVVYLSQIQSGREGINLSSADCLIMYNIDFSAVSYWQSRARLQTKDRIKPAEVHWLFAKDGIEWNIYKAVSNKKDYTLNYFKKDML